MKKSLNELFNNWLNEPINFPNWLGYLLIAVLACFLNTFMLTNMFKSVGIQQQFIEARSDISNIQASINPINTRLAEIEKQLKDKIKDKNKFIIF